VIAKNLIEALKTHAGSVFLPVVANLRTTPDALNEEHRFWFVISEIHRLTYFFE